MKSILLLQHIKIDVGKRKVINIALKLKPDDKLLKPYLDSTFKAIFTSNTEESDIAFCNFLTGAIGEKVVEAVVLQNEPAVTSPQERQVRYDIACEFKDGERANIEVQVFPAVALPQRLEYYASKLLLTQRLKGDLYQEVKRTYQISILVEGKMFADKYAIHYFEQYDRIHDMSLNGNVA
jgi:predicted transposase/invertase (TIGR01784 family)